MRRRLLASIGGKQLPYESEVEYIESTGTQYIDVGFVRKNTYKYVVDFRLTKIQSGYRCVLGDQVDGGANRFILRSYGGYFCSYGLPAARRNIIPSDTSRHLWIVDMPNGYEQIDNSSNRKNFNLLSCLSPLTREDTLFRLALEGEWINMELYAFSVEESGGFLIDLIPVRFTNENGVSEGAMYDRVSGKLFRNAGTGAFIIGPEK